MSTYKADRNFASLFAAAFVADYLTDGPMVAVFFVLFAAGFFFRGVVDEWDSQEAEYPPVIFTDEDFMRDVDMSKYEDAGW